MKLKHLTGIIFDVHKTLVDDSGFPRERIWKLLRQSGVDFEMSEYYRLYDALTKELFNWPEIHNFIKIRDIHRERLNTFYRIFHVHGRDVEEDVNYLWRSMGESSIYPEVPEILHHLKSHYQMGILSNADNDDPLIEILLKHGFEFDAIITSESAKAYKPKPVIFQKIMESMNCEKHEVILIGDSLISDVLGARNFGIKVIWVNRTGKVLEENHPHPDYQIQNLSQLLHIIHV